MSIHDDDVDHWKSVADLADSMMKVLNGEVPPPDYTVGSWRIIDGTVLTVSLGYRNGMDVCLVGPRERKDDKAIIKLEDLPHTIMALSEARRNGKHSYYVRSSEGFARSGPLIVRRDFTEILGLLMEAQDLAVEFGLLVIGGARG